MHVWHVTLTESAYVTGIWYAVLVVLGLVQYEQIIKTICMSGPAGSLNACVHQQLLRYTPGDKPI